MSRKPGAIQFLAVIPFNFGSKIFDIRAIQIKHPDKVITDEKFKLTQIEEMWQMGVFDGRYLFYVSRKTGGGDKEGGAIELSLESYIESVNVGQIGIIRYDYGKVMNFRDLKIALYKKSLDYKIENKRSSVEKQFNDLLSGKNIIADNLDDSLEAYMIDMMSPKNGDDD